MNRQLTYLVPSQLTWSLYEQIDYFPAVLCAGPYTAYRWPTNHLCRFKSRNLCLLYKVLDFVLGGFRINFSLFSELTMVRLYRVIFDVCKKYRRKSHIITNLHYLCVHTCTMLSHCCIIKEVLAHWINEG